MKRVLLKLSGEFLQGNSGVWSEDKVLPIVDQIKRLQLEGNQIGPVVGGGNIFRGGKNHFNFDRYSGDAIGMAATCVNALFLKACLQQVKVPVKLYGASLTGGSILPDNVEEIRLQLSQGNIVIFSGGTGHAYFSTDTAAALRAIEIQADVLLKATKVDGVYDQDPCIFKEAKKFDTLTYAQVCDGKFGVMDACAFDLCREQKMPIFIFNLNATDAIYNAVHGSLEGTLIKD